LLRVPGVNEGARDNADEVLQAGSLTNPQRGRVQTGSSVGTH